MRRAPVLPYWVEPSPIPCASARVRMARRTARFTSARFTTARFTARLFTPRFTTARFTTARFTARLFTARLATALLAPFRATFSSFPHESRGNARVRRCTTHA